MKTGTRSFKTLSASDILSKHDFTIEAVPCPEWGGTVFVRNMTGEERDRWEYEQVDYDEPVQILDPSDPEGKRVIGNPKRLNKEWLLQFRARMVSLCACDEQGNRIFTDEDVPAIQKKNTKPLIRLVNKINELSQITDSDMESLVKNLDDAPDSDSPTD